jgi:hypothetical protein
VRTTVVDLVAGALETLLEGLLEREAPVVAPQIDRLPHQPSQRRSTRVAFVPPNPKEFESTTSGFVCTGL